VLRRTGLVVILVLILSVAAACTSDRAKKPAADEHAGHTASPPATTSTPEQVQTRFEQLLGQHALLAVRLMRSVSADTAARRAEESALAKNTTELSQAVSQAYGSAQADGFTPVWQRLVADVMTYAEATAKHDATGQQTARTALAADSDAFGKWAAAASKGRITAEAGARTLQTHVDNVTKQLDAYASGDYVRAYKTERDAYRHMFTAGSALAQASFAPDIAARLAAPPEKLRSGFAMLLGEHMELIVGAQRAAFAGSRQFKAAATEMNANSDDLGDAITAIAGPESGEQFQKAWADHVEGLMAYTAAVAGGDGPGKAAAKKRLEGVAFEIAEYLNTVVNKQIGVVPLTAAVTEHDEHLIGQVDAYAAKNYTRAQQMELDGYQQMRGLADTLVDAIQQQVGSGLPKGGSQTGGGGTAPRP
jgi:hypothetical protein